MANSPAAGSLELATINPGLVLGPMIGNELSTFNQSVKKLMDRELPCLPRPDLRLRRRALRRRRSLAAMTAPEAAGQRFVVRDSTAITLRDVAACLAEYNPQGYRVPTGKLPGWALKVTAKFDSVAAMAVNDLGNPQHVDNRKVVALLGRPLRDLETMTLAMAASLEQYGHVSPRRRGTRGTAPR